MHEKSETFAPIKLTEMGLDVAKPRFMQSTVRQFQELAHPIRTFEALFHAAIESLLPDLADAPWYIREREVVNLFVFRHLIPQFQAYQLDIAQIGIEVPVLKVPSDGREKPGIYADIAVWPHRKATLWRTCKPIARIEWKNISCRELNAGELQRKHEKDIDKLRHDCQLAFTNLAVLTVRHDSTIELNCKKVGSDGIKDFCLPLRCKATGDEATFKKLTYKALLRRPQAQDCPQCRSCRIMP